MVGYTTATHWMKFIQQLKKHPHLGMNKPVLAPCRELEVNNYRDE